MTYLSPTQGLRKQKTLFPGRTDDVNLCAIDKNVSSIDGGISQAVC